MKFLVLVANGYKQSATCNLCMYMSRLNWGQKLPQCVKSGMHHALKHLQSFNIILTVL